MYSTHIRKDATPSRVEQSQDGSVGLGQKLKGRPWRLAWDPVIADDFSQSQEGIGRPVGGNPNDDVEGELDQLINGHLENAGGLLQAGSPQPLEIRDGRLVRVHTVSAADLSCINQRSRGPRRRRDPQDGPALA